LSVLSFAQWAQASDFFTFLRQSWYVYPIVLTTHIVAIAMSGGMILMVDLRLLGVAMRKWSVSDVVDQLRVLKRIGLVLVVTCGLLLAGSKAEEYYYNKFFWTKMSLLTLIAIHALIFRRSVYGNTAELDQSREMPGQAKLAASLSLILWTCVMIAGRGIGYIEPPLEKLHAHVEGFKAATPAFVASLPSAR
jgi:hypothetical protein